MPVKHPFEDKYPAKIWKIAGDPRKDLRLHNMQCCGVKELHGIQQQFTFWSETRGEYAYEACPPALWMKEIQQLHARYEAFRPVMVFTDNNSKNNAGGLLADYIEANELGPVHRTERVTNYNSMNKIVCYMWTIDKKRFQKFKPEV